jgi:alpha,alpha-trehalase
MQGFDQLFEDVQMKGVFPDGKTFVDCLPRCTAEEINSRYATERKLPGFNLGRFVLEHFELPVPHSSGFKSDAGKTISQNINALWDVLTRQPDKAQGTLIPLPYPYVVPGGRFGEIYYWDSYFTMLGLEASGRYELIESMVKNFSYLIDTLGYIPNGNRTYFLGRSQPPFYSLMVGLAARHGGQEVILEYLPRLEKEYQFWMNGIESLKKNHDAINRVVKLGEDAFLNRYWDANDSPRPESYREDVELARQSDQPASQIYRHLRAGAESGWDYSSRWFRDPQQFSTIQTTDIIPVDLNCLLYHLEKTISAGYHAKREIEAADKFYQLAERRKEGILRYCWNDDDNFFVDYHFKDQKQRTALTLAGLFPLFMELAEQEQADQMAEKVRAAFLKKGGVLTTLEQTGQQWDAPNGWAPLQWVTIKGLSNYGHHELADEIAGRWTALNETVFARTGKLMEKYNVVDTELEAGGGEYAGQDGFGWTNGVFLALKEREKLKNR